jgi:hypothetical protein
VTDDPDLRLTLQLVIRLLVNEEYAVLARLTGNHRLPENHYREAISRYGYRIIQPPDSAFDFDQLDVVAHPGPPRQFGVWFRLWTQEEGQSDLTIMLMFTEVDPGIFDTVVEDLRVP